MASILIIDSINCYIRVDITLILFNTINMPYYISKEDIQLVKYFIEHKDVEMCGVLLPNDINPSRGSPDPRGGSPDPRGGSPDPRGGSPDPRGGSPDPGPADPNRLKLYVDSVGQKGYKRGLCYYTRYATHIWHTHNKDLIAYPSPEDLIKVLKYRLINKPNVSIIFTKWGIWEIFYYGNKLEEGGRSWKYAFQVSNHYLNKLYWVTERGRGWKQEYIPLINKTIQKIQEKINQIPMLQNNYNIRYTPWIGRPSSRVEGLYKYYLYSS